MSRQFAKVIVNPAAGAKSTYRKWPEIQSCLKKSGLVFDYQFTEGKGQAIELARDAAGDGYRYLIAVGGDGTVNEVANGILQSARARETALGIISTGTGSDLARSIGISLDYTCSCTAVAGLHRRDIDIGYVEYRRAGQPCSRYFVNSAGIGFDATVVAATEQLPKFFGGTIPYLTGLVRSFLFYRNKNVTFRIGEKPAEKARVLSIVVANGGYFGGGMHIAPGAQVDDSLLDIVITGNFGKIELLRIFPRVYKGTHLNYPKIRLEKAARIDIESAQKFLLHADGELLGEGPVSFKIIPRSLGLIA
jgi:diacylglycerol kinase (ATP)